MLPLVFERRRSSTGGCDTRPTGAARDAMSLPRRLALLAWARRNDAWIIEDDYLSELQLKGRAAPALASLDHGGRVLHIGSFSKTISPALRLGFLVAPPELAQRFGDIAACLAPAPAAPVQCAAGGTPAGRALPSPSPPHEAALCRPTGVSASLLGRGGVRLDEGESDRRSGRGDFASRVCVRRGHRFARPAIRLGAKPAFALVHAVPPQQGLLLGVTNLDERRLAADCRRLLELAR